MAAAAWPGPRAHWPLVSCAVCAVCAVTCCRKTSRSPEARNAAWIACACASPPLSICRNRTMAVPAYASASTGVGPEEEEEEEVALLRLPPRFGAFWLPRAMSASARFLKATSSAVLRYSEKMASASRSPFDRKPRKELRQSMLFKRFRAVEANQLSIKGPYRSSDVRMSTERRSSMDWWMSLEVGNENSEARSNM